MTILHESNFLQVGFKIPIGSAQRERAVVPKGGCLAAICTFSHCIRSFLAMIPNAFPVSRRKNACIFGRHGIVPQKQNAIKEVFLAEVQVVNLIQVL